MEERKKTSQDAISGATEKILVMPAQGYLVSRRKVRTNDAFWEGEIEALETE